MSDFKLPALLQLPERRPYATSRRRFVVDLHLQNVGNSHDIFVSSCFDDERQVSVSDNGVTG